MVNIEVIPDDELSQTLRLMKAEIVKRGWTAELAYVGSPHCFVRREDGTRLHVYGAVPPTTSYAAASLANDKYATYQVLKAAGMPQLECQIARDETPLEESVAFMEAMGKIVVKPLDGAHGEGITVNVSSPEALRYAMQTARAERRSMNAVLLQQQYVHETIYDLRVLCINYHYYAATWRVPARVVGDGVRTIKELITSENASERRGKAYYAPLATIDLAMAEQYLGSGIDSIPTANEVVTVLGVANYGAGGEIVDVTDVLPSEIREIAQRAARICQLPVAGIDFMIAAQPTVDTTLEALDAVIIEVNKSPMLALHDEPISSTSRGAVSAYLDYLATIG